MGYCTFIFIFGVRAHSLRTSQAKPSQTKKSHSVVVSQYIWKELDLEIGLKQSHGIMVDKKFHDN